MHQLVSQFDSAHSSIDKLDTCTQSSDEGPSGPAPAIPPRPERTMSIYTKPVETDKRASMVNVTTNGMASHQPTIAEEGIAGEAEGRNGKKERKKKMTDEEVLLKLRSIVRLVFYIMVALFQWSLSRNGFLIHEISTTFTFRNTLTS